MSELQVMHLDLKTKNVLLTADMVGKVHFTTADTNASALDAARQLSMQTTNANSLAAAAAP